MIEEIRVTLKSSRKTLKIRLKRRVPRLKEAVERNYLDVMPKKEFIKRLSVKLGATQVVTASVIEAIEETILEGLHDYEKVKFAELVYFVKKDVPTRPYTLPGSNEVRIRQGYDKVVATVCDKNKRLRSLEEIHGEEI